MYIRPVTQSRHRLLMTSLLSPLTLFAVIGVLVLASAPQPIMAARQGFVRVNQVGYASTATKRAYFMAPGVETGARFSLKNSAGVTIYSAPIGANLGSWSSSFPYVYALDFGSVTRSGTYTISISGPISGSSPGFLIAPAAQVYKAALANALSFFQNERDGADYIPSPLRTAPGHLNDAHTMTYLTPQFDDDDAIIGDLTPLGRKVNASGAWWDAGDYVKFVETTSYTVDMMEIGLRDFAAQMGTGSARANFTNEAKFGLDWLQHMWDDATSTLYYQVGIGSGNDTIVSDHDIWRLPQVDDTYGGNDPLYRYIRHRPVFRAAPAGSLISPNLAGRLAGDFALCFQIFRASRPDYAKHCLISAEHIFDLANTHPSGDLLTAAPFDSYPETEWRDDMELGATELYFALAQGAIPGGLTHTDPAFYLRAAAHWASAYIHGPNDATDTLNLYDVSGMAHYELYRAITRAGKPA
ncbi:MAG TPA: glycoside hydrolase family 9 protein, partial [Ktedonobacteraceae bacterium]|nr:glycoside hydrolase family 9 protein [Ktedonobacteraceae bacterium]